MGAWVAGELPQAERAALAAHAAACEQCRALLEALIEARPPDEPARPTRSIDGAPPVILPGPPEFAGTDRFAVVRRLGTGGMGVVYEVWDREREAPVALKTLRWLSPHGLSLFKNEFRALRGLSHRNLVTLGELVKDRGRWFFTMELVDGTPFLSWVRRTGADAGARFDEARLRDGLRQLAGGLCALHRCGKVHCDIKPSNVLVTRDGRVVVLDFGLVRDVRDPDDVGDHAMGTPAYMAPEQVRRDGVGPAADWYAVGVMLYTALCGVSPFDGAIGEVLAAKAEQLPPRPALLAEGVPADLDALCMRLLAIAPAARAGGDDVLRVLGGEAGAEAMIDDVFLGREAELAELDAALAAGGPVVVAVRGESGIGKSTLLRRWHARAAGAGAVVLAGRCCERESVPYKALDGVIEALARWLAGRPAELLRALAPPGAELLARVFPALSALAPAPPEPAPGARPEPAPGALGAEPADERRHLFEAVRALLGRLARRHRLVVSIDDLHWTDADSLAMLAELLRPPAAPPLVLVIAERGDRRAAFEPPCPVRHIDVGPLAPADAAALAATLLPAESQGTSTAIAAEARGHPLFVLELARARQHPDAGAVTRLDDALARRVEALGDDARAVIEVVGAAGAPIAQAVVAEASGVALGPLAAILVRLRDDRLVATGGLGPDDRIDAYHSRVRAAVLRQLDAARARSIHARIAAALERRAEGDPERLFGHWREAGDRARARRYAIEAADAAAGALAFDRAARLYRAALALEQADGLALRRKLAAALVNAGRGAEAARALRAAAATTRGREALDLRRRAAEQLLRSGHVDAGLEALDEVIRGVGLRLPASARGALPSLLAMRARLRLRGLDLRRGRGFDPRALARVDACWSASTGLLMVDWVRAAAFHSRMLRLALDAGDPYRAALALALEAGFISSRSTHTAPRVADLLDRARGHAAECGEPHAHGFVTAVAGTAAFLQGRFAEALATSEHAERVLCTCPGVTWERDTVAIQMLWTQVYLGAFGALGAKIAAAIREAEERDDRYRETALRTGPFVWVPLVRGDLAAARRGLDDALRRWTKRGFLHLHWDDLLGRAELDLHTGAAELALSRMRRGWRSLAGAQVFELQLYRERALHVRGRAALRRARQLGAATAGGRGLLARADDAAARLYRERVPYISALADLLSAGIAAARAKLSAAAGLLRRAVSGLDASGLALHAAAARLHLAGLLGGSEGTALRAAALAYAAREGITALPVVAETLAPGFSPG